MEASRVKLLDNIDFCWVLKGDAESSPCVGSGVAPDVGGAPAVGAPGVGAGVVPVDYYVEDIAC